MQRLTKSANNPLIVTSDRGVTLAKASKTNTSDTDTGASAGEDIAAMKAELAELRTAKAHLSTELTGARGALKHAEFSRMSAQEQAIASQQEACDSGIDAMEGEAQSIEDQIAVLSDEPGHGKEIAQLSRKLATVSANLVAEGQKKTWLAGQREKVTAANKQTREAAPADAGAKLLANGIDYSKLGVKTQAWLDAHPKAFTDVRYAKLAVIAAQKAVDIEGLEDQSPDYFKFIEQELGESPALEDDQIDDGGEEIAPAAESYVVEKPQARAAGPGAFAAAPTRQTPAGGTGRRAGAITLTADEREVALGLYPNIKSDADKLARYAEGKAFMAQRQNQVLRSN